MSFTQKAIQFPGLLGHLEKHWGPLTGSWTSGENDQDLPFHLCLFENVPFEGANTLVTTGVSETVVSLENGTDVRQELVMCVEPPHPAFLLTAPLLFTGMHIQQNKQAVMYGDLITLPEPIEGTDKTSLYATAPHYFPPESGIYHGTEPLTMMVWLVPVTDAETKFIVEEGFQAFENLMGEKDPDVTDLTRSSVV